jgi:hypothetical protein
LAGNLVSFLLKSKIRTIKGVATRNLRNPKSTGDISLTVILTATNEPAQTKLTKASSKDM